MFTRVGVRHLRVLRGTNCVFGVFCRSTSAVNAAAISQPSTSDDDGKAAAAADTKKDVTEEQLLLCLRKNPSFELPHKLQHVIKKVWLPDQTNVNALIEGAQLLNNQLWGRQLPSDKKEIKVKSRQITNKMFGDKLENLDRKERKMIMPEVKEVVVNELRLRTYHWRAMNYDTFGSYCYLLARTPMEYAVLRKVFKEISILDPNIVPHSCLDFGSGTGSVWWALKEQFPSSFKEYFSVEPSKHMRDLARYLAQEGPSGKELPPSVYSQRAQLPAKGSITYDIVVSAFSLLELTNARERRDVLKTLWAKTKRHLVIIENGTRAGFAIVQEARAYILQLSEKYANDESGDEDPRAAVFRGYVLAPCTHNLPCQRMHGELVPNPCSFPVRYRDLLNPEQVSHSSLYSYVVLTKCQPDALFEGPSCARIISEVLPRTRHVVCRMCTSKGEVKEKTFSKGKHDRQVYKTARSSKWGDLFLFEDISSASKGRTVAATSSEENNQVGMIDEEQYDDMEKEMEEHEDADETRNDVTDSNVILTEKHQER